MEAISEAAGYKVRHQAFNTLANRGPEGFPRHVETVKGIAVALDLTEEEVLMGYAVSLGIPVRGKSSFETRLPPRVDELDPEIADNLIRLIRSVINEGSGEHDQRSTTDMQAAGSAATIAQDDLALAARTGLAGNEQDTDFDSWGA